MEGWKFLEYLWTHSKKVWAKGKYYSFFLMVWPNLTISFHLATCIIWKYSCNVQLNLCFPYLEIMTKIHFNLFRVTGFEKENLPNWFISVPTSYNSMYTCTNKRLPIVHWICLVKANSGWSTAIITGFWEGSMCTAADLIIFMEWAGLLYLQNKANISSISETDRFLHVIT